MKRIWTFLAEGFEEVEALTVVDILKRAKFEVTMVSISEDLFVTSSHNVVVKADKKISELESELPDVIFLPGGMPGTLNLGNHESLKDIILKAVEQEKIMAAVCAAPSVYGQMGLLKGRKATCYPGFEDKLLGAEYQAEQVVVDGTFVTSQGMGTCIPLGLKLVELLSSEETALQVKNSIRYF
ncbi:MAG: DJ-1/PfpI family protein [Lachnospiraceae bacterium]|nr:DJ-1/PfpI family protein [Lachnospiraceae bacterium]